MTEHFCDAISKVNAEIENMLPASCCVSVDKIVIHKTTHTKRSKLIYMQTKPINECTDIELKSVAYDEMLKINKAQELINVINQELANRAEKAKAVKLADMPNCETPRETSKIDQGEENVLETTKDNTEE